MIRRAGRAAARLLGAYARLLEQASELTAALADLAAPADAPAPASTTGHVDRTGDAAAAGAGAEGRIRASGPSSSPPSRDLDLDDLVRAPVREVLGVLGDLDVAALGQLHERESSRRARAGVLDAIEREVLRRL